MMRVSEALKVINQKSNQVTVLSNKDGVVVARIYDEEKTVVIKHFEKDIYRREIQCYDLLNELNIPTIKVLDRNDTTLLLEDMAEHDTFRLATKEDLKKRDVVVALSKFYKELHDKGEIYIKENADQVTYSELDLVTSKNIEYVKEASGYKEEAYWQMITAVVEEMKTYVKNYQTLTYNDFFYGNLIVKKDLSETFVFDYNFLGRGLRYFDLNNVMQQLSKEHQTLFLKHYGDYNPVEKMYCDTLSPLIGLIIAFEREVFPNWAKDDLNALKEGHLYDMLKKERLKYETSNLQCMES